MKMRLKFGMGCVMLLYIPLSIAGQSAGRTDSEPRYLLSASSTGSQANLTGQVYREIVDPNNGDRWLLMRDSDHPGGPGRLVLAEQPQRAQIISGLVREQAQPAMAEVAQSLVIHSGDRLIVERTTAIVEERLEAVALGPAVKGSSFEVRLKIGGKVFRAVALGPGRATFDASAGGQP